MFQQPFSLKRGRGFMRVRGDISHLTARSGLQAFTRPRVRVETVAGELSQPRFFMSTTGGDINDSQP